MSLTLWQVPQELQPTYNQVIVVATSSLQSNLNYQLVSDIYCRGQKVTRMKTPVNPEGYVVLDIHKHLENQISFDFNPGIPGFNIATNSFASYSIVFYDEFRAEWEFTDNQYNLIGATAYIGFAGQDEPYFEVGDSIYVSQDVPYTNPSYNGVHTIISITQSGLTWSIVTDALYGVDTPPEGGVIQYADYQLTTLPVDSLTLRDEVDCCVDLTIASSSVTYSITGVSQTGIVSSRPKYDFLVGGVSHTLQYEVIGTLSTDYWVIKNNVSGKVSAATESSAFCPPLGEYFVLGYPVTPVWNSTSLDEGTNCIATASSFPEKYVFNGVLTYLDCINWDYDDWDANTTTNGKFFTNVPDNFELDIESYMFLNVYQNSNNEIKYLKIKSNLGTYSVTNSFTTITADQRRFLQVNGSVKDLFDLGWIDNTTKEIEIWCENTTGDKTIESKIFKIVNKCSIYDKMQIIFMDKMGSFIPYTFNKVNRENRNISRTEYQQHYGTYAPAAQNWTYKTWDRGKKSLDTIVVEQYTLNSDWVNQSTSDYLMELFESPEVYLVKPDGVIIAINLTVQSIERKQVINEQLINYQLTFELSNKNMQQRG